jgi:hypothetical protein
MRSRRTFLAALMSGAGSVGFLRPFSLGASTPGSTAANSQTKWLLTVLPQEDKNYDPIAKMLVSSADGGPGYHTTIKTGSVHGTRASLTYAVALLDTGEAWRSQRAKEILKSVIPLQDQDPSSKTYGLWPWYLEEPLSKMSPPDFNWADFCGTQLMMAWLDHRDRLGRELAGTVRESILHAARSIQQRNVSPSYTNIAIMGTFVTLAAAQEFQAADLRTYARERLKNLYSYITKQGSFAEYNSPTYSLIAIQELSRILRFIKDSRVTELAAALHELAWKHVATHFHPPTQQWAGPHSRCYATDVRRRPSTLAFIQAGTGGEARLALGEPLPLNLEAAQVPLECPRRLTRLFAGLERPRQVTETFVKSGGTTEGSKQPVIGITWLHPKLTVGSVNRGDFWTQRRPLLAYWGTPEQTTFLRARFLKDGEDFTSALIFTAQYESNLLSTVVLSTDHGDKHPVLDPIKDGTITTKDLRLRLEFGGDMQDLVAKTIEEKGQKILQVMDKNIRFLLRPMAGRFAGSPVVWDQPALKAVSQLDAVFYQGEEKTIDLNAVTEAFLSFALQEWPYQQKKIPSAAIEFTPLPGVARSYWKVGPIALTVTGPTKPGPYGALTDTFTVNSV